MYSEPVQESPVVRNPGLPREMVAEMQRQAGLPACVVESTLTGRHRCPTALSQVAPANQICFSRLEAFVGIGAVAIVSLAIVGTLITVVRR